MELDTKYAGSGLHIMTFPCNQFGAQEPGSNDQICEFAAGKGAKFMMMDKARPLRGGPFVSAPSPRVAPLRCSCW